VKKNEGRDATPTAARTRLSRRDLRGFAAKGAASVVVAQSLTACAADAVTGSDTGTDTVTRANGDVTSCVQTAALTQGPFFDEKLNRSDIRSDPVTGAVSAGVPLRLKFTANRVDGTSCTPLTGAYLDVWHCDASDTYSDVSGNGNGTGGAGHKFLRGYQVTDGNGVAQFTTIYPGWYSGRAVHVQAAAVRRQLEDVRVHQPVFFDESLTSTVHAQAPYSSKGQRNTLKQHHSTDGIYNSLSS
jgi:protocatechuate 3,4-dioxygenase beta subunit